MKVKSASEPIVGIHLKSHELSSIRPLAKQLGPRKTIRSQHLQSGQATSPLRGQGMDYLESRHYHYGDDIRHIDWKVSARTQKVHTKVFQEKKFHRYELLVDFSPSMFFGSQKSFKTVLAAKIAMLLAFQAEAQGYELNSVVHNLNKPKQIFHKNTRIVTSLLLNELVNACQEEIIYSKNNLSDSLSLLLNRHQINSSVFIISDFYCPFDILENNITKLASRTNVTLIHVMDELEISLPDNKNLNISNGKIHLSLNSREIAKGFLESYKNKCTNIKNLCKKTKSQYWQIATSDEPITTCAKLLNIEPSIYEREYYNTTKGHSSAASY